MFLVIGEVLVKIKLSPLIYLSTESASLSFMKASVTSCGVPVSFCVVHPRNVFPDIFGSFSTNFLSSRAFLVLSNSP